ncbi:hypothetical protein Dsin_002125 [Dipteronia sinensis]|uniref:SWIM-type domain-containing protein n=1 Tax=Dipteronia sinensis TaxID=43782 RepID=A0AAE0EJD9_9ROSI|nr:hypothetical protein Dsin_002125 [Dipteronia sinensis]
MEVDSTFIGGRSRLTSVGGLIEPNGAQNRPPMEVDEEEDEKKNLDANCSSIENKLELVVYTDIFTTDQHNEIKASFERSLTLVQHSFKPSDFKELREVVSRNALNMVLDKYERVDSNDSICSCVIRLTHGLPCAHEISGYKREG